MKSVRGIGWRLSAISVAIPDEERQRRKNVKDILAKDWITRFSTTDIWDRTQQRYYDLSTYKK